MNADHNRDSLDTTQPESMLTMTSVAKSFGDKSVLNQLDFRVAEGKVVGLLGRNGAGKSTLIECALGLRKVDRGDVSLLGDCPPELSETTRARIGYVSQHVDLFGWMTAPQMLSYFKAWYPHWNDEKVSALMHRWSIPQETAIGRLSGGEKQRLAIIRALAHEPDFLILDEPAASLDPAGRRDFLREVIDIVTARNATVLFSTHILSDLERVAVDVSFLCAGKILLSSELDALADEAVVVTGNREALQSMRQFTLPGAMLSSEKVIARIAPEMQELLKRERRDLSIEKVSLEDFFIEVTK
jgi:ABC-2 type transport system ATP-binding protein